MQFNQDWSFLIPGVMSLIAQVSGENKFIWRATFVIAAALGMYFTARLIMKTRTSTKPAGPFRRYRWIVIVLYLLILIFGGGTGVGRSVEFAAVASGSDFACLAYINRAWLDLGIYDSTQRKLKFAPRFSYIFMASTHF